MAAVVDGDAEPTAALSGYIERNQDGSLLKLIRGYWTQDVLDQYTRTVVNGVVTDVGLDREPGDKDQGGGENLTSSDALGVSVECTAGCLFDIDRDPGEATDISRFYPDDRDRLRARVEEIDATVSK